MNDFVCTYRLQLGPGLGFREARALVPYLRELGVSHLYLSPALEARPGSTHGYDVVDPTSVSSALGGEDELRALAGAGLGIVLDVVPNHMAADEEHNPFWRDPLWRAKFFDLDWRTGAHRRFFDVGELAGVRVEDPEVFEVTHRKVLELVADGVVQGLRIDHPDGLAEPARYLERLREAGAGHVWVEKILEPGEQLPEWPVEGTTGYDFLAEATAAFVDPAGEEPLTACLADVTGERRPFAQVAHEAKLEQARNVFDDEVGRLAALLPADVATGVDLASALASLPVYRTYADPLTGTVSEQDRRILGEAALDPRLAALLLLEHRGHDAFVLRFQQTTPAVAGKGVEDTAFYRWPRLLALNEVGSDPGRFCLPVGDLHRRALERAERFPRALLATTTHDTKRSADVRARLVALSAEPGAWRAFAERWLDAAARLPDPATAYFVLQTLVGAWPLSRKRLDGYLEKALREEKRRTSWLQPDPGWEDQVRRWTAARLADDAFRRDLEALQTRLAPTVERASLGQVLLKLTSPGVPDLYQGDELPYLALVDPDNRRPVDWEARRRSLTARIPGSKIELIRSLLRLRAERPAAFAGGYEPLEAGPDVCSFVRGGEVLVAVALRGDLSGLRLPPGPWRDAVPAHPHRRVLVR
ncbi:MAG TPA: malto-oligosyltrehalose synthase [Gaiellaceae bacterium]|nr:malto-oligosyltrehalose synthase [Gaiellaceae bacterium]